MGRQESSSGGAIAVIIIAAIALLGVLVVGLAIVGAGFFFVARSSYEPMSAQATVSASAPSNLVVDAIAIEADDEGTVLVEGEPFSDEEFRVFLVEHMKSNPERLGGPPRSIFFALGDNVTPKRQAEIQAIYDEVVQQSDEAFDAAPAPSPLDDADPANSTPTEESAP